ncbi:BTB/POZ domain-containing protein [Colletotrichum tofieldiae]|uniref:BTB/POZ domain-containing protein n=1 Tax=Colletotrichum tofieldiae TaxID=708197 RepID=A0A166P8D2_9PEZI|nr:BTB/POZ domain-containing protein [Colletotrichum tofieldiae]
MSDTGINPATQILDPVEELKGSLRTLYENAEYSDLTIASRDTEYRVHKAIVCPRSDYFAAKFRESKSKLIAYWKAAIEGFLSLPDDDPLAVGMVIRYFYHLDYPSGSQQKALSLDGHAELNGYANDHMNSGHDDDFNGSIKSDDQILERDIKSGDHNEPLDDFLPPQPQRLSKKQKKRAKAHAKQEPGTIVSPDIQGESLSSPTTQEASVVNQTQENHSEGGGAVLNAKPPPNLQIVNGIGSGSSNKNLVLHANVYALSRKYGISGLRSLAFEKFKTEADNQWDTEEFLHAAEKVYTSCSDGDDDRKMKDVVVGMICRHGELMDKVETQKVMRTLPKDLMYDILLQVRQQGGFTR